MTGLPGYLRGIGRVVADQAVASSPLALRVRERLPHLPWEILPEGRSLASGLEHGDILHADFSEINITDVRTRRQIGRASCRERV